MSLKQKKKKKEFNKVTLNGDENAVTYGTIIILNYLEQTKFQNLHLFYKHALWASAQGELLLPVYKAPGLSPVSQYKQTDK